MGSFKQVTDTGNLRKTYFKRAIVYLESQEDYLIVGNRWFHNEGELLEFKSADEGAGGGANQVIDKVTNERSEGVVAFGLVDRDALLAKHNWDSWWQRDDDQFAETRPFGEHVRVLKRWEIENYLLEPSVIEEEQANLAGRAVNHESPATQLIQEALGPAKLLSAASITLHARGQKLGDDLNRVDTMKQLQEKIAEKINSQGTELQANLDRIEQFGEGHPVDSRIYWERISRMLDGKRILKRLGWAHGELNNPRDYRLSLATKIRLAGKIDPEFTLHIEEFKSVARSSI